MEEKIPEFAGEDTTIEHVDSLHALLDGGVDEGGCDVDIYKVEVH